MEHTLGELFGIGIAGGNLAPEEHAHLRGIEVALQRAHDFLGQVAASAVGSYIGFAVPLLAVAVGFGRCQLYAAESSAVDVALDFQYPLDELGVRGAQAHTPARHVVALRHRVELNAAVLGAGHLQERQRMVVQDEGVGVVVHHDDAMVLCEPHQALVGLHACCAAGGHVGIVGPHQLDAAQVHLLQRVEVGLPAVVLHQVVVHDLGTENFAERRVGGIAWIGHEYLLAGVDEGQRGVQDALLAADERLYLGLRVQLHAVPAQVEVGHGLAQFGRSHRGLIAVGIRVVRHAAQLFDGLWRRRHVGTADGQTDDVAALCIELGHFLQLPAEIVFRDLL